MRLQAAAAFLAQSLEVPLEAGATISLAEKRRRLFDEQQQQAYHQVSSERLQVSSEAVERSQTLPFLKKRVAKRQSIDLNENETGHECDPQGAVNYNGEDLEADLGFLSCDPDEECVNSELSQTGGVCIKVTAQIHKTIMQRRRMQSEVLCVDPTCDCSDFDAGTYIGTITCTYPETYCSTSSMGAEYCYITSFTLFYEGLPYADDYRFCYDFTSGGLDRVCQLITYEGDCEIEVDNVVCPMCLIATCPVTNQGPEGFVWDCSGTTLDSQGSECDGNLLLPFQDNAGTFPPSVAPAAVPPPPVPVTSTPVTVAPVTPAPITPAPVTAGPSAGPTAGPSAAPVTEAPTTSAPSISANPTKEPTASDKFPCVTCLLPQLPNGGIPDSTNSLSGATDTITPPVEAGTSKSGGSSVFSRAFSLTTMALVLSVAIWTSSV